MPLSQYAPPGLCRQLRNQSRPYWRDIAAIMLLDLLATPLPLLKLIPLKSAVDNVVGSRPLMGFLDILLPNFLTRSVLLVVGVGTCPQVLAALHSQLQAPTTKGGF